MALLYNDGHDSPKGLAEDEGAMEEDFARFEKTVSGGAHRAYVWQRVGAARRRTAFGAVHG